MTAVVEGVEKEKAAFNGKADVVEEVGSSSCAAGKCASVGVLDVEVP